MLGLKIESIRLRNCVDSWICADITCILICVCYTSKGPLIVA